MRTGVVTEIIPFRKREDRKGYDTGYTVIKDSEGEVHKFNHCAINQVPVQYQVVGAEGSLTKTDNGRHWLFQPTSKPDKEIEPKPQTKNEYKSTSRQLSFNW